MRKAKKLSPVGAVAAEGRPEAEGNVGADDEGREDADAGAEAMTMRTGSEERQEVGKLA
jgi:hypothetical protein